MRRFLNSIELALQGSDWYGALSTALTLPDICGRIERPEQRPKDRYIDWFNQYLLPKYTAQVGSRREKHVFLHGEDCYALRCSYLHEGGGSIAEQRARKALDSFHFITPPGGGKIVHLNQVNSTLQLQVDIFCRDMVAAAEKWITEVVDGNSEMEERLGNLLEIHDSTRGIAF